MTETVNAVEKHYTITELCELLQMSFSTVRLLIKDEPGVLKFQTSKRCAAKRARTMYRIPESVLQRIIRRRSNPERYQVARDFRRLVGEDNGRLKTIDRASGRT